MKRHENDLNPKPLTVVYGFKEESCCQVSLPNNNRTHSKPTDKGHRWFPAQSGYSFIALNPSIRENPSRLKAKSKLNEFAGNPGMINLYPEIIFPGFPDCFVATNFRMRSTEPKTHPAREVLKNLLPGLSSSSATMKTVEICHGVNCSQFSEHLVILPTRIVTCFFSAISKVEPRSYAEKTNNLTDWLSLLSGRSVQVNLTHVRQ